VDGTAEKNAITVKPMPSWLRLSTGTNASGERSLDMGTTRGAGGGGNSSGITVVEMAASIARESFGVGYAALNLSAALARNGVNVFLASVDKEQDACEACEEAGFPRERLIRGSSLGPSRLRLSPRLMGRLLKIPNDGRTIVHSHAFWTFVSCVAGRLSRRWQCPLVVSPHGSLEPYALQISYGKKALASLLYERRNLRNTSCFWALSEQEEASIRSYGFHGRVEVIPNGVTRAEECSAGEVTEFRSKQGVPDGSRIVLFLSRIARKKNLPLLLNAFAKTVKARPEWTLLIAGSDERGHIDEVQALIRDLGIENSARLIGPLYGREKARALTSASVFVLPSHSEGLPIAVLEAMEYGKPVLATDGWELPVKTTAKFGWRVPAEGCAFEAALLEAMSSSEDALMEMGRYARAVVRAHFDWDAIALKAVTLYECLLADRGGMRC
jgi:poly(glycerol-phosphate) alpha-glucosyltransferase